MDSLTFDKDTRHTEPNKSGHRRARFRQGWLNVVEGKGYGDTALKELTWDNLIYRLGKLFGETTDEMIEQQYEWCVHQQRSAQNR
jgi:hypothetical protein